MREITVLTRASSKSRSLRTTVPMSVVKHFNLSEGDKLAWKIEVLSGELVIIVKPIKVTGK